MTATRHFTLRIARIGQSVRCAQDVAIVADRARVIEAWLSGREDMHRGWQALELAFAGADAALLPLTRLLEVAEAFEAELARS